MYISVFKVLMFTLLNVSATWCKVWFWSEKIQINEELLSNESIQWLNTYNLKKVTVYVKHYE